MTTTIHNNLQFLRNYLLMFGQPWCELLRSKTRCNVPLRLRQPRQWPGRASRTCSGGRVLHLLGSTARLVLRTSSTPGTALVAASLSRPCLALGGSQLAATKAAHSVEHMGATAFAISTAGDTPSSNWRIFGVRHSRQALKAVRYASLPGYSTPASTRQPSTSERFSCFGSALILIRQFVYCLSCSSSEGAASAIWAAHNRAAVSTRVSVRIVLSQNLEDSKWPRFKLL